MSNQGHIMMLHTYTSKSMFLPSINFLYLTVSEIQPRQTFYTLWVLRYSPDRSLMARLNRSHTMMRTPKTSEQYRYQASTSYTLYFSQMKPRQLNTKFSVLLDLSVLKIHFCIFSCLVYHPSALFKVKMML